MTKAPAKRKRNLYVEVARALSPPYDVYEMRLSVGVPLADVYAAAANPGSEDSSEEITEVKRKAINTCAATIVPRKIA